MVILDEAGEPVGEGILAADSDCPTTPGVAGQIGDRAVGEEEGEIVSLPSCTALHVAEEAIPEGIADAAGQRGKILGVKATPDVVEEDQVVAAAAGPVIITLDADHPSAGELIIAAALQAAEEAAGVRVEGLTEERIADQAVGEFPVHPKAADVAAEVTAGPTEDDRRRCWRRRLVDGPEIGRRCRSPGQRGQSDRGKQKLLHCATPFL